MMSCQETKDTTDENTSFDTDIDCQFDATSQLMVSPRCFGCFRRAENDNKPMQRCSRCHCAYYCCRDCQVNHYKSHKEFCLEYKKLNKELTKEKNKLLSKKTSLTGGKYFSESTIGHFWTLFEPRTYCRVRYDLAEHILMQAHYNDLKPIYDRSLSHYMELLRLVHGDNLGVRNKVPFILITLNRDEDAYNFIKWWLTIDPHGKYNWGNVPKNTKEGDWLYLTNENIFEDCGDYMTSTSSYRGQLAFVASLALIKFRLVSKLKRSLMMKDKINSYLSQFQCNINSNSNSNSDSKELNLICNKELSDMISDIIVGNYVYTYPSSVHLKLSNVENMKKVINEQESYVDRLLKQLVKMNKMFVQSLVNPGPMRQQNYPQYSSPGSPQEAFIVMNNCCRLFARTPGARQRLEALVGKTPHYNPQF